MPLSALSCTDANAALDLIHKSVACEDVDQFNHLVEDLRQLIGFDSAQCVCGDYGKYATDKRGAFVEACTFPAEWVQHYVQKDYLMIDPVTRSSLIEPVAQYWADAFRRYKTEDTISLDQDAKAMGLEDGWTASVPLGRSYRYAIFSLAGQKVPDDVRSRTILAHALPHLAEALRNVCLDIADPLPNLTPREIETLSWLAEGKTAWEISVILGISQRTVEYHIKNIVAKLDASSARHAVAIALSRDLLKP